MFEELLSEKYVANYLSYHNDCFYLPDLGELIPKSANGESKKAITETVSNNKAFGPTNPHSHHNHRRTHIRSRSDASALISSSVRGKFLRSVRKDAINHTPKF